MSEASANNVTMNTIEKSNTLGSRLRERREGLGLNVQDVAREVKISSQYVRALEEGSYETLSAKVYAHGFLKKILKLFIVEETESWFGQFDIEWDIWEKKKNKIPHALGGGKTHGLYITSRMLFLGIGGALLAAFLVLAGIQVKNFTGRPPLIIEEPQDRLEIRVPFVTVRGQTEKESRLTVNGREITIDGSGNFSEEVELLLGVNELVFIVQNRFGKETSEVRYVVVK